MLSTASVSFVNATLCDSGILMQIFAGHFEHVLALVVYSRQNNRVSSRKKNTRYKTYISVSFDPLNTHFQTIFSFYLVVFVSNQLNNFM